MADNSTLPVSSGTEVFSNKDVGGVKFPSTIPHNTAGTAVDFGAGATTAATPRLTWASDAPGINPNAPQLLASSTSVGIATDDTMIGPTNETAPATDTTASGLNGALKRIAQRLTTLIGSTLAVALQAATSGGLSRSRTIIPNNTTAIVVKASAGQVYKIRATNNSAVIGYIHLYDATSATAGSGTPVDTIMIPASSSGGAGIVDTTDLGVVHATGITYTVTTGIADADTAAPAASAYIVTMYYK